MPTLGAALDFSKYEGRNFRGHQLGAAPSSPVTGQLYYNTADNTLYWWDGSQWVSARGGAAATPPATTTSLGTVQLAGDLAGTATSPQIAAGVIVDADVAAANKDGAAGTPSLRTLGTGANQAAPGNDSRFTDSRPPTGAASGDLTGTYPAPQIAAGVIVDTDVNAANKDGLVAVPSMRTIGTGAQQAMAGNTRLNTIAAPNGAVDLANFKITTLGTPTNPFDAATKNYVDGVASGLDVKASCRVASTGNVSIATPGATIDGVTLASGNRVLLKDQTTPAENGIWIWNGASSALSRAPDADNLTLSSGAFTFIEEGTVNADTGWVLTTNNPITVGVTSLAWAQFSGAGQITAGGGLTKTGNTLDVGAGAGITVNADTIQIATGGVTDAMLATPKSSYYSSATHGAGTTITIPQATHGCRASRGLLVQVQDEATGNVEIPDISVSAAGQVTVTYGAALTANSKRVTISG